MRAKDRGDGDRDIDGCNRTEDMPYDVVATREIAAEEAICMFILLLFCDLYPSPYPHISLVSYLSFYFFCTYLFNFTFK